MNYSQNNEQQIVGDLLAGVTDGRLLDIGAYVPDTFSNSRSLIDAGWSAVLVEPSPVPFIALLRHYASNPKVQLANVAITNEGGGWVEFYDSNGDALSSYSQAHKSKWETGSGVAFSKFHLFSVTVASLLDRFGANFDFISLDVEGMNLEIFNAIPMDRMKRLKVICVEHDGNHAQMLLAAAPFGFKKAAINGENLILSR